MLFNLLAAPLGFLLYWLYQLIGQYWLAIVLLSILIRVAMYPVYKKQIMSTVNMAEFQPKIAALQNQYKNDRATLNQKIAELQKEEGYNPMMGCLPALIQLIVLSGLFVLLRNPLNYMSKDMVFAVHESFLWIGDMSQPDPWILPILSGVATYFGFSLSAMAQQPVGANNFSSQMMKYLFPLMFVWLARSYPAGLALYWLISQIIQIFFNFRFNKLRRELKAAKIIEKRRKNKKTA